MYSMIQLPPSLMQRNKLSTSSTTMTTNKITPKKAVGFASSSSSSNAKYSSTTTKGRRRKLRNISQTILSQEAAATIVEMISIDDYELQSTDVRRRYLRRGSKAPSMMQLSKKDRAYIEETTSSSSLCYDCNNNSFNNYNNMHHQYPLVQDLVTTNAGRRLSIMSILNCHFDQVTIVDKSSS